MVLSIDHESQHTQHGRDPDATGNHDDFTIRIGQNVAEPAEGALNVNAVSHCDTADMPPEKLNAIIDTTPVWRPVVEGLRNLAPGGRLVINAIRKEAGDREILADLDYDRHLWREKSVQSVANVTRRDVRECLALAAKIPLRPSVSEFALEDANRALIELRQGQIRGAKVLRIG